MKTITEIVSSNKTAIRSNKQEMQLRSGRSINYKKNHLENKISKPNYPVLEQTTNTGTALINLLQKYVNYVEDIEKKNMDRKRCVLEKSQILIELFSIANDNFDILTNEIIEPQKLIFTMEKKAEELIYKLEEMKKLYHLRGSDHSLMNYTIIELYLFLKNVKKYRKENV